MCEFVQVVRVRSNREVIMERGSHCVNMACELTLIGAGTLILEVCLVGVDASLGTDDVCLEGACISTALRSPHDMFDLLARVRHMLDECFIEIVVAQIVRTGGKVTLSVGVDLGAESLLVGEACMRNFMRQAVFQLCNC